MISQRQPRLFLSYAREDRAQVEELYEWLKDVGFKPWMDVRDIISGEDWEQSVWRAIHEADFFLACLSKVSVRKRGFVQKELVQALSIWEGKLEDDIYLIPIRFEECSVPNRLSTFQRVDLFDPDGYDRLKLALDVGVSRRFEPIAISTPLGQLSIETRSLYESMDKPAPYFINIEHPHVAGLSDEQTEEINITLRAEAYSQLQSGRSMFVAASEQDEKPDIPDYFSHRRSFLEVNYQVSFLTPEFLSLRVNSSYYGVGAMHSQEMTETLNFRLSPLIKVGLSDLFNFESGYVELLSQLCIDDLKRQAAFESEKIYDRPSAISGDSIIDTDSEDSGWPSNAEWIAEGAGPVESNFSVFNLVASGVVFYFSPYAVGPYAWGTRQVTIPLTDLTSVLDVKGPVRFAMTNGFH